MKMTNWENLEENFDEPDLYEMRNMIVWKMVEYGKLEINSVFENWNSSIDAKLILEVIMIKKFAST